MLFLLVLVLLVVVVVGGGGGGGGGVGVGHVQTFKCLKASFGIDPVKLSFACLCALVACIPGVLGKKTSCLARD